MIDLKKQQQIEDLKAKIKRAHMQRRACILGGRSLDRDRQTIQNRIDRMELELTGILRQMNEGIGDV
jgi:hypothetical protein